MNPIVNKLLVAVGVALLELAIAELTGGKEGSREASVDQPYGPIGACGSGGASPAPSVLRALQR